jgi:phosphatidylglycerophosphatase A
MRNPLHLLAFGFGSGLLPRAPGTYGTLVGVVIYLPLQGLALPLYSGLILAGFLAGVWICGATSRDLGVHDHSGIVWDEIIGYLLTMVLAPAGWIWALLGFLLFRFFDILKPWPIRWFDQRVPGGFGIMFDDALAGLYAGLVMQLIYRGL